LGPAGCACGRAFGKRIDPGDAMGPAALGLEQGDPGAAIVGVA
jgi:hypothetical protein